MVGRWEKWNSVWISSPAEPFYSNTKENDLYRFQILNNPENKQNWTWLATPDVNYGKFSNGSYPYQLWEVVICTSLLLLFYTNLHTYVSYCLLST